MVTARSKAAALHSFVTLDIFPRELLEVRRVFEADLSRILERGIS